MGLIPTLLMRSRPPSSILVCPPGWWAVACAGLLSAWLLNLVSTPGDPFMPVLGSLGSQVQLLAGAVASVLLAIHYALCVACRAKPAAMRSRVHALRWGGFPLYVLVLVAAVFAEDEIVRLRFGLSQSRLERAATRALASPVPCGSGWVGLYFCYAIRSPRPGVVQLQTGAFYDDDGALEPVGFEYHSEGAVPGEHTLTSKWYCRFHY